MAAISTGIVRILIVFPSPFPMRDLRLQRPMVPFSTGIFIRSGSLRGLIQVSRCAWKKGMKCSLLTDPVFLQAIHYIAPNRSSFHNPRFRRHRTALTVLSACGNYFFRSGALFSWHSNANGSCGGLFARAAGRKNSVLRSFHCSLPKIGELKIQIVRKPLNVLQICS